MLKGFILMELYGRYRYDDALLLTKSVYSSLRQLMGVFLLISTIFGLFCIRERIANLYEVKYPVTENK